MRLIDSSIEILTKLDGDIILRHIENATRTCYNSFDKVDENSHKKLLKTIIDSKHESVLEHYSISVKVICSRACMAQWTRHRKMSYSVQSQRYVCYTKDRHGGEVTFIRPMEYDTWNSEQVRKFDLAMEASELHYKELLDCGLKTEDARNALNNACKTEMIVTANLRSWVDFLRKRTPRNAQDEIRFLARRLLMELKKEIPIIFDDIKEEL